jgi:quinolinate synthase
VLVHPECKKEIADLADVVGSTQALLNYAVDGEFTQFLVCTESGILHEMQKRCPEKEFIPVPPAGRACANNECDYMRMNTLEKLYLCLRDEQPAIEVDEAIRERAVRPIHKMLEMSK